MALARAAVHAPVAGVRSFLLLFALLAAFLGQDIVTQSHVHPLGAAGLLDAVAQPGTGEDGATIRKGHPAKPPTDCPICRELAMAGHYLAPDPVALAAPLAATIWLFVQPVAILARSARSHSWRSRAPPL